MAFVHQVARELNSQRKAAKVLMVSLKTVENCERAHRKLCADGESFYHTPEGWEILRKRADAHVEGELAALRAAVALMKVECHRAGVDYARRELLSEVGWEAFAVWRTRHRPPANWSPPPVH